MTYEFDSDYTETHDLLRMKHVRHYLELVDELRADGLEPTWTPELDPWFGVRATEFDGIEDERDPFLLALYTLGYPTP